MNTPIKLKQVSLCVMMALGVSACADIARVQPQSTEQVSVPVMQSLIMPLNTDQVPDNFEIGRAHV